MNKESYYKAHRSLAYYDASGKYGRVAAIGPDAIDLLHRMSTNDLLPLIGKAGSGAQTVLTNEKGRIIDLLTVLSHGKDALLITSGGHEDQVITWLDKFVIMEDAKFVKKSEDISQFLIFGPQALEFLQTISPISLISLENFHFIEIEIAGEKVLLQKTHRIIESGWAIFVDSERSEAIKTFLLTEIGKFGGTAIDDDTYNTLRIEAGIPLAPSELNEKHNPLETTLVQAVSWTKGCYIGQEVIARLDTYDKVQRHLMGVIVDDESYTSNVLPIALTNSDNEQIGEITSAAFSLSLEKTIALAFVKSAFAIPEMNTKVGEISAKLVKLPFEI